MSGKAKIRCAIYTRKSSEEGLEQEFNSLDAQHEACAAYVASQKHEGWVLLKDRYDDGGISGGTLERPAVQRLLADIDAGRVDRVVVYKVDRLTRSLADFAKLVERFDQAGASFVSVTQSFNTATSMGRLTLNVLLSFAQFEREVTAERIRDKIAASKKKGMWMGGVAPLGYDGKDRTLVVNDGEAATVRMIFDLYLRLGSIRRVQEELDRLDVRTKHRPDLKGTAKGGALFGRGALHHLLANPVYVGRIRHKEKTYAGAHAPIIEQDVWQAVQDRLIKRSAKERGRTATATPSPLAGKIVDETGDRLTPSHANKKGRRYRYYVSHRLISPTGETGGSGWRVPADRLETAFAEVIASKLEEVGFALHIFDTPTAAEIERIRQAARGISASLRGETRNEALAEIVSSGSISSDALAIDLRPEAISQVFQFPIDRINLNSLAIVAPWRIRQRGVETRFVIENDCREIDQNLATKIGLAMRWFEEVKVGVSIKAIADRESVTRQRVGQVLRLAMLDPSIVEDILVGQQPDRLTVDRIIKSPHHDLWSDQRAWAARL